MPWIYMLAGVYLYEVIPQKYGISKHPLFCFKRNTKKKKRRVSYEKELTVTTSSINDEEVLSEISRVSEVSSDRENYPLIVESLTKVCFL